MENYYDRLKLPVDASDKQIKMQYRRLAKRCHPDLNPDNPKAAEQFHALHTAYTVLSDPDKRRAYDARLSRNGHIYPNTPGAHHSYQHWAGQPRAQARVRRGPRRHMFTPDKPRSGFLSYTVELSIQELFKGARRNLTVGQTHSCPRCRGKGVLGNGDKCPRCAGFTFLVSYEQVELMVPPGVLPGTMIRVEIGEKYSPAPVFDVLYINEVLVTIEVREGELYMPRAQHLYTTVKVPAAVLEEGGKWELPAPEGGELPVILTIPPQTASGSVLTLRRQGLKNGASQRRGNLYCTLVTR